MLDFFKKKTEKNKSPERMHYEEEKTRLKAEIRHLTKQYKALIPVDYSNSWVFLSYSGYSADYQLSNDLREKRMSIHDRITRKQKELEEIKESFNSNELTLKLN